MSNLYLYNYNNYFNRIVKKESSLANYGTPLYVVEKTNFDMNDSVETSHVVNYNGFDGDYVIITDDKDNITSRWFVMENQRTRGGQHKLKLRRDLIVDNYDKVINAPMLVNRAMISDKTNPLLFNSEGFSFNEIKKEEMLLKDKIGIPWIVLYIAKNQSSYSGTYNVDWSTKADITLTTPLANSIYVPRTAISNTYDNAFTVRSRYKPITILSPIQATTRYDYTQKADSYIFENKGETVDQTILWFENSYPNPTLDYLVDAFNDSTVFNQMTTYALSDNSITVNLTNTDENKLIEAKGKIIKDSEGKYYLFNYTVNEKEINATIGDETVNSDLYDYMKSIINSSDLTVWGDFGKNCFNYKIKYKEYRITATMLEDYNSTWSIDFSTKQTTNDADYNIIAIPYGDVYVTEAVLYKYTVNKSAQLSLAQAIAKELTSSVCYDMQIIPYCPITKLLEGAIYPYTIDLDTFDASPELYSEFGTGVHKTIMFYCESSNFTFNIIKDIKVNRELELIESEETVQSKDLYFRFTNISVGTIDVVGLSDTLLLDFEDIDKYDLKTFYGGSPYITDSLPTATLNSFYIDEKGLGHANFTVTALNGGNYIDVRANVKKYIKTNTYQNVNEEYIDYKIDNECDKYRLCSPNYNGLFEFSVVKNDGVDYFNVDMTLKPFNPYIHVNPNFKSLYGADYNDVRGLICGGDFSLPIINDAFKEYELRNKNYQLVFDRQIQHMDYEYSRNRQEAIFGATVGSIGAGVGGAVAGGMSTGGNPIGAGFGALLGAASSAVGGAMDVALMKERQAENKDFVIDNFKYQLGNIKALPYSLNKITPLTYNNKIFPFIEYYTCTDKEKSLLKNKLKFNSMNVSAIDYMINYIQAEKTFISGSLIRLEELDMQMHEASEIYNEVLKGVFI